MSDISTDILADATAAASLKRSVRVSVTILAAAQVASQCISLFGLAILLRLLSPNDYGLVGMVVPLVMFLRIFATLGLNVATVQRPDIRPEEISALFWLNLLAGCATAAIAAFVAPSVGWLYAKPEVAETLRNLSWGLAATSLVVALGAQHQALLEREMKLGRLSAARIVAQLVSTIAAIAAAVAGWGVWALVVQTYVELGLLTLFAWCLEPWRPGLTWPGAEIAGHLRLGGYFVAASIVFYVGDNLDRVLVGRLVGPEAVGLYSQAYAVMIKPVYVVVSPLIALMLASLSRAADQPDTRRQLVVAYYRLLAVILLPAAAGLVVVGPDVMRVLGGAAWSESGALISVMSLGMFGQATILVGTPILTAAGRTGRLLAGAITVAGVLCAAYFAGWWFGERQGEPTLGVAWGYVVGALVVLMVPYIWYCAKSAGYQAADVLAALLRPAAAAIVMGVLVWAAGEWLGDATPLVRLVILVPLGAMIYCVLARQEVTWLTWQTRQMFVGRTVD